MKKLSIIIGIIVIITSQLNAQENDIIGFWQLSTVEVDGEVQGGFETIFIFAEDDVLKASRSLTSQPIEVGTWNYDEKLNTIIMKSDIDRDFRGTATNVKIDKNTLVYYHNDATLSFIKVEMAKPNNEPIPTLTFSEEDFWTNDEFKYPENESKLPWTLEGLYSYLKDKTEIVYTVNQYKKGFGKVDSWSISYKINFNKSEEISIRKYSYFQKDYIDMSDNIYALDEYNKETKVFYPLQKIDPFRVIGEEILETTLGEFNCTIVEGIGDFGEKIKYWMINTKPGVYAKIITIKDTGNVNFNSNKVYLLNEIK